MKLVKYDSVKWLGPYKPTDRHADDVTVSEMVRLRKENEWYRDILKRISQSQYNADAKDWANAALEEGYRAVSER